MLDATTYDLLMETSGAIAGALAAVRSAGGDTPEPRPPLLQVRAGRAESPGWFLVQAAEFAPAPLTVAALRDRDIYASERIVRALLELMATEQWLERVSDDGYQLTEAGWTLIQRSRAQLYDRASTLEPSPVPALDELAELLCRLIRDSLASPTPPGTWCLAHSRQRAPAEYAPVLIRLRHYFDDFNAFRDDAHMAAWQSVERCGAAWEAFALVCAGEADSADGVFQRLVYRGYSRRDYAAALCRLAERGWLQVAAQEGTYQVAEAGHEVRAHVERMTDAYFYAPWARLASAEVARLRTLLAEVRDRYARGDDPL